jgi:hypothetical protein
MIVEVTKERIHEPSLHWLRGDLLNATGDRSAAEQSYPPGGVPKTLSLLAPDRIIYHRSEMIALFLP